MTKLKQIGLQPVDKNSHTMNKIFDLSLFQATRLLLKDGSEIFNTSQPSLHLENLGNSSRNQTIGDSDICHHLIGTYVVPSLLHFLAFAIGFYHFRIQEHEGLYALMEKV